MSSGWWKIYYLIAESSENAKSSPHLEVFRDKGIEVLLLFDRIDEWMMSNLHEFDGKAFVDVMRGDLALPGGDAKENADEAETDALTERIKAVLEDRVEEVRPTGQGLPESKPVFEYNARHPLLVRLDQETDEDRFRDLVLILFDQASLADGTAPKDSAAYVNRLNQLLLSLLND